MHELIVYVTRSDKIGHIAEKYMCSVYQLNCGCYLNIVCFVQLLRISAYNGKNLIKIATMFRKIVIQFRILKLGSKSTYLAIRLVLSDRVTYSKLGNKLFGYFNHFFTQVKAVSTLGTIPGCLVGINSFTKGNIQDSFIRNIYIQFTLLPNGFMEKEYYSNTLSGSLSVFCTKHLN